MLTRARLTGHISTIVKQGSLRQKEAAEILELEQPDVSALMNGKILGFSVDWRLTLLARLNQEVEITIKPAPKGKESQGIQVHSTGSFRVR